RGLLRDLPAGARGAAFIEVPVDDDVYGDCRAPEGVSVTWLPRNGSPRGTTLHAAALHHLGTEATGVEVSDEEIDPDLWETPAHSSSGEDLAVSTAGVSSPRHAGLYAWIAGESKVVTGLRRALVRDLGLDRKQVAFMGYWREGVSMRS
ncbi:MAG: siderophore-interacting protein, partial [Nocardioidaceae bacterium]|nr:siderophore-interacting protein [Nocardioidaceae bacterium]